MKTSKVFFALLLVPLLLFGFTFLTKSKNFKKQEDLDKLLAEEHPSKSQINWIKLLQYQEKYDIPDHNGIVIPKKVLIISVNGFTVKGLNLPDDKSNFDKWDFLVVYPGLEYLKNGIEKIDPVVMFYKGGIDKNGKYIPIGEPVEVDSPRGGGGPGDGSVASPPPKTIPKP